MNAFLWRPDITEPLARPICRGPHHSHLLLREAQLLAGRIGFLVSFLEVETGKRQTGREVIMKMDTVELDSPQVEARRPHVVSSRLKCIPSFLYRLVVHDLMNIVFF